MDKINKLLTRRVDKIYPSKEALEKALLSGKKLRLYQGFDPSTANLHIGHLVGLLKLKEFQELGHEVIFLIGDFTGMIGDPTGKTKARKPLTREQVLKNAKTYQEQAGLVLNFSGNNPVKLKFNSEWNSKLNFSEVIKLASCLTVPQLLERDMFQERTKKGEDIYLNEFMYPLVQGYDSVAMDVDLEIGGSDQMFNMMIGRDLMNKLKKKEKFVLTTKLLVDSQGNKIGKTEGNAINIANPPEVLFGQIMSLSDDCILSCFELITEVPLEKVAEIKKSLEAGENPMKFKKELARTLVEMLQGKEASQKGLTFFEKAFQKKEISQVSPTFPIKKPLNSLITITDVLLETDCAKSRSEAKRLVEQGAVEINESKIKNHESKIRVKKGDILKVGKRKWLKFIE